MLITIDNKPLTVEVMTTDEQMAQGLQNRPSMPINNGILFDIGIPRDVSYHTRNCLFPIDIIFINIDNQVIKILHSVKPEQTDLICSGVRYVVETNGGWAINNINIFDSKLNINKKDSIINAVLKEIKNV